MASVLHCLLYRGVEFVRSNENYDEKRIKAFECDITSNKLLLGEIYVYIINLLYSIIRMIKERKCNLSKSICL